MAGILEERGPKLVGGVVWKGGRYHGVVASLAVGFATWVYTLLMPAVLLSGGSDPVILRDGAFGITWLRPQALFGVSAGAPRFHSAASSHKRANYRVGNVAFGPL